MSSISTFHGAIVVALVLGFQLAAKAEDPKETYRITYQIGGLLLRAAYICEADSKSMLETSFALQTVSTEIISFGKAFPTLTQEWMMSGSKMMNDITMQKGVVSACLQAGLINFKMRSTLTGNQERETKKQ